MLAAALAWVALSPVIASIVGAFLAFGSNADPSDDLLRDLADRAGLSFNEGE